jgi:hypothetical protein
LLKSIPTLSLIFSGIQNFPPSLETGGIQIPYQLDRQTNSTVYLKLHAYSV